MSKQGETLIVPAPALAEVLTIASAPEDYMNKLTGYACIEIGGFDGRAAFEFAKIIQGAIKQGDKRSGVQGKWQHLRIDRQIVAIAKSRGATTFYTDDGPQEEFAKLAGMKVVHTWELDLPPERAQQHFKERGAEWPIKGKPAK